MAVKTAKDASGPKIAAEQLIEAARARKCRACDCLGSTLFALDKALQKENHSSELPHAIRACYLGRELARAERCLGTGVKYVQDAAPDRLTVGMSCGCSGECH